MHLPMKMQKWLWRKIHKTRHVFANRNTENKEKQMVKVTPN